MAEKLGYKSSNAEKPVTLTLFADDSTPIRNSRYAAVHLLGTTIRLYAKICLEVSPAKSKAIIVQDGILNEEPLVLSDATRITAVKCGEKVRYSGATVSNQLDFDAAKVINKLAKQEVEQVTFDKIHADQKLNLLNSGCGLGRTNEYATGEVSEERLSDCKKRCERDFASAGWHVGCISLLVTKIQGARNHAR